LLEKVVKSLRRSGILKNAFPTTARPWTKVIAGKGFKKVDKISLKRRVSFDEDR
jgi:hypothetical protein